VVWDVIRAEGEPCRDNRTQIPRRYPD
jgi:hypothetical protein